MFHYDFEVSFEKRLEPVLRDLEKRPIDDLWRGSSYDDDRFSPPHPEPKLPMYILANRYCPTGRDVFLEKVRRLRGTETKSKIQGHLYHLTYQKFITTSKRYIMNKNSITEVFGILTYLRKIKSRVINKLLNNDQRTNDALISNILRPRDVSTYRDNMKKLWEYESVLLSARAFFFVSRHPGINIETFLDRIIPYSSENQIDGSRLNLSENLSVDVVVSHGKKVIIDIKTGNQQDFHRFTTTGYALAYESDPNVSEPVDIGCIVYIKFWNM